VSPPRAPLPIDPLLPEAVAACAERRALVLVAEPGAGKTTRLPRALFDATWLEGEVLVLEPRRLAARLAAERVASELGERAGERVGYETRLERAVSGRTRLRFLTEGILTRRLLTDPTLRGVGAVVLDELHERHLATDLALTLLRRLRKTTRPDLVVVAMSATLDAEAVARFLDAPVISAPGRVFPVEIEHATKPDDRPLAARVAAAVADVVSTTDSGHVLVFLPGAREIRLAEEACAKLADRRGLAVLPLHGSLAARDQDRAIGGSEARKVILSTNVAETSVTIDDVGVVIDSGLALVASCSPWTGVPALTLSKISKASATQRAGRAGRTRAGRCVRLYTASDFAARAAFETPEIARLDLSEALLEVVAHGVGDPAALAWFDAPPQSGAEGGLALLRRLGAIEGAAPEVSITKIGRDMLRFPCHPRHARIIVEGERLGVGPTCAGVAALLSERTPIDDRMRGRAAERSDVTALLAEIDAGGRAAGLDRERVSAISRSWDRLARLTRNEAPEPAAESEREDKTRLAILMGFPDRVGRVRRTEGAGRGPAEVLFASGGTAILSESSRVREADLVVAVDVEERTEGMRRRAVVKLASAIDSDWPLEHFLDDVTDEESLEIPPGSRRVEAVRTLRFGSIVLDRTKTVPSDSERVAEVLAQAVLSAGLTPDQTGALDRLAARLELLRAHMPDLGAPSEGGVDLPSLVRAGCRGLTSLDEAKNVDFAGLALASLPAEEQRALREHAPDKLTLPSGRQLTIEYVRAAPPSVSSRLQDFFGMVDAPKIARGRVALVLHLLAPNGRDVQVTTDLAGFWERHYPTIAKELRRKYPRHAWPDDPRHAEPPAPRRR
jgi:ATP-dependent helicase HrpB